VDKKENSQENSSSTNAKIHSFGLTGRILQKVQNGGEGIKDCSPLADEESIPVEVEDDFSEELVFDEYDDIDDDVAFEEYILGKNKKTSKKSSKRKRSGADEWCDFKVNIFYGCSNDCLYCYAKSSNVQKRKEEVDSWLTEKYHGNQAHAATKPSEDEKILVGMFPTTHDIIPKTLHRCVKAIGQILSGGHNILITSKPRIECIDRICKEFKEYRKRIMFMFTIGSANDEVLNFWDNNAPSFTERLECLKLAYNCGFATNVSCEPMLDDNIEKVVEAIHPYIRGAIWLGMARDLWSRMEVNGWDEGLMQRTDEFIKHHEDPRAVEILKSYKTKYKDVDFRKRAEELEETQNDERIIELYNKYKDDKKIRFKESIVNVVADNLGIDIEYEFPDHGLPNIPE
jgi:DNA repair photolyase